MKGKILIVLNFDDKFYISRMGSKVDFSKRLQFISYLFCAALIFVNVSCNERKEKIEQLENIREHAGKEKTNKNKQNHEEDTLQKLVEMYQMDSVALTIEKLELLPDDKKAFLNRFTEKSSFYKLLDKDTTINLTQHTWQFADSVKVKNAFYNWLDEEKHSKIGSTQKLYSSPALIFVTDKQIIELVSNKKLDVLKWIQFVRFNFPNERFLYILSQNKGKKTAWLSYENRQLTLKTFSE